MLVLIQVSSIKTSFRGSRLVRRSFQRRRRRAMSGRACSRANCVFFEAQALAPQELPHRIMRDEYSACAKLRLQRVQRKMRGFLEPLLDEIAMRQENPFAMSAHLAGATEPVAR